MNNNKNIIRYIFIGGVFMIAFLTFAIPLYHQHKIAIREYSQVNDIDTLVRYLFNTVRSYEVIIHHEGDGYDISIVTGSEQTSRRFKTNEQTPSVTYAILNTMQTYNVLDTNTPATNYDDMVFERVIFTYPFEEYSDYKKIDNIIDYFVSYGYEVEYSTGRFTNHTLVVWDSNDEAIVCMRDVVLQKLILDTKVIMARNYGLLAMKNN